MKSSVEALRSQLISILADGEFHSGQELGLQLAVSRATISNHIKALGTLGLDVHRVTGKGYKLAAPLNLLCKHNLQRLLVDTPFVDIEVLNVTDSTNAYVKTKMPELSSGYVCLAEAQTAGKGRHGRPWVSPYGASLYMSMYWHFAGGYAALGGLSLAVGVIVAETLQQFDIENVQLKWPNDIYIHNKKLAGVLIEVEGHMEAGCDCILGIGLNMALPPATAGIDQPWIDLASASSQVIDRNVFSAALIARLHTGLKCFETAGLSPFIDTWRALDLYAEKPVKLILGKREIQGIGKGIDSNGAIKVLTDSGLEVFHGGEISVRSN